MELVPMNKTNVISHEIAKMFLKLWNVSKYMRKRLIFMLKDKIIIVRENKEIPKLIATLSAKFNLHHTQIQYSSKVIRYKVTSQSKLDQHLSTKSGLVTMLNLTEKVKKVHIPYVFCLNFNQDNALFYTNLSFGRVNSLKISEINSADSLYSLIQSIGVIDLLEFGRDTEIELDLSFAKNIRKFNILYINIKKSLKLPCFLEELVICGCLGFELVNLPLKLNKFSFWSDEMDEINIKSWLKQLKSHGEIKKIDLELKVLDFMTAVLPSKVRKITNVAKYKYFKEATKHCKKANFPLLFHIGPCCSAEMLERFQFREIPRGFKGELETEMTTRPRRIVYSEYNSKTLSRHPELFEKITQFVFESGEFNFALLPDGIKNITIKDSEIDLESLVLSRF